MGFDWAIITDPDGRAARVTAIDFYALPLGERIQLVTSKRVKFEKDGQPISPLEALRRK